MRYLHTMVRVSNLEESLDFYCNKLGLAEVRRYENEKGRFTLVFLAAPDDVERARNDQAPVVELTYNWDPEEYKGGRNFGHLAYSVDDIYATCQRLKDAAGSLATALGATLSQLGDEINSAMPGGDEEE